VSRSPDPVALAERVQVLRDEVLDTAGLADQESPGAEVLDAIVRRLEAYDETSPGLDLMLHEAISRRLAWGDSETKVLADADAVCRRLLEAAQRAFREPEEEVIVASVAVEVGCAASRIVALAVLGRASRERAAQMREELAQNRLRQALERQREELGRLQATLEGDF
jgi:hypothetical protein